MRAGSGCFLRTGFQGSVGTLPLLAVLNLYKREIVDCESSTGGQQESRFLVRYEVHLML